MMRMALRHTFLLLLLSVSLLDVHLRPQIALNVNVYEGIKPAPKAKRLVLIVSDGLRKDIAYKGFDDRILPNMPFLLDKTFRPDAVCRSLLVDAPTESRPNHVAMLAGFPEELSNLLNGWKKNGRKFDHLLKRASFAFAFGGPDVIDYFDGPNVELKSFEYERYHFEIDPSVLDQWTLEQYRELLKTNDAEKKKRIEGDKTIFFLHLAGVDTNGHRYGALSPDYRDNAHHVDTIIEKIESATREKFDDEETLFIFTADHGFPDVGGHGTTDSHARSCPFVAWGVTALRGTSRDCKLEFEQKGISPFAAALLGLATPSNNRMSIPDDLINVSIEERIRMLTANFGQLLNEYKAYISTIHGRSFKWYDLITLESVADDYTKELARILKAIGKDDSFTLLKDVQELIKNLGKSRTRATFLRAVMTGLPFALGCIGLIFLNRNEYIKYPRAKFLLVSIFSIVPALFWSAFAYTSIPAFISAYSATLIWVLAGIPGIDLPLFGSVIIQSGVIAAILWSPWTLVVLSLVILFQMQRTKSITLKRFILCASLAGATLSKVEFFQHAIPVFGIPYCSYEIFKVFYGNPSGFEHYLIRSLALELGLFMKTLFVSRLMMPSLYIPLAFLFYAAIGATLIFSCVLLRKRGNLKAMSMTLFACGSISTLIMLTDPLLVFSICAILDYVIATMHIESSSVYESVGKITERPRFILLVLVVLLSTSPGGLSYVASNMRHQAGPMFHLMRFPPQVGFVISAVVGLGLFTSLINRISQNRAEGILESQADLALTLSGPLTLIMMVLLPYKESWLEIGTGIGKIYYAIVLPLISCVCLSRLSRSN